MKNLVILAVAAVAGYYIYKSVKDKKAAKSRALLVVPDDSAVKKLVRSAQEGVPKFMTKIEKNIPVEISKHYDASSQSTVSRNRVRLIIKKERTNDI